METIEMRQRIFRIFINPKLVLIDLRRFDMGKAPDHTFADPVI
jgi:hypothetical protein